MILGIVLPVDVDERSYHIFLQSPQDLFGEFSVVYRFDLSGNRVLYSTESGRVNERASREAGVNVHGDALIVDSSAIENPKHVIEFMPPDVLTEIFGFLLVYKDICALSQTCITFRSFILSNPTLLRSLIIDSDSSVSMLLQSLPQPQFPISLGVLNSSRLKTRSDSEDSSSSQEEFVILSKRTHTLQNEHKTAESKDFVTHTAQDKKAQKTQKAQKAQDIQPHRDIDPNLFVKVRPRPKLRSLHRRIQACLSPKLLVASANCGNADAGVLLAKVFESLDMKAKAFHWWYKSAKTGKNQLALFKVGDYLYRGILKQDAEEAAMWLKRCINFP